MNVLTPQELVTELIAIAAYGINKTYCELHGDGSQPKWEDAPKWKKDSVREGVRLYMANPKATPEDSHKLWYMSKLQDGWTHGTAKDVQAKRHPNMQAYANLNAREQHKFVLFRATVLHMRDFERDYHRAITSED